MQFLTDHKISKPPSAETLAICLVLTCSLQIMENLLPKIPIFPWLRLGLAYWILLPFLIRFGVLHTLLLFMSRNLITLIYGGQIFSSFLISSCAGVLTFALTGSLVRALYLRKKIGLVGFSVLLACSFNAIQLGVVNLLLVQHSDFYFQLSPILFWSLISGCLTAFLVFKSRDTLIQLLSREFNLKIQPSSGQNSGFGISFYLQIAAASLFFVVIFLTKGLSYQLIFIPALLVVNRFKNLKILLFAWPFYFYIATLHLFRTDGVYIVSEWITREGLDAFLFYTARTTNIILCGQWMAAFLPSLISRYTKNRHLKGILLALPILPALFGISIGLGRELFIKIKNRQLGNLLDPIIEKLLGEFFRLEHTDPDQSKLD
jgi:uncharacterized membrane protein